MPTSRPIPTSKGGRGGATRQGPTSRAIPVSHRRGPQKKGKKKGGGSFWGRVGGGLEDLFVGSGIAAAELVKNVGTDIVHHPLEAALLPISPALATAELAGADVPGVDFKKTSTYRKVVRPMAKDWQQRYTKLAHDPIGALSQDPIPFAMDALMFASLGAGAGVRGAAALSTIGRGESLAAATRAALSRPALQTRYAAYAPEGGEAARVPIGAYSRNPATRQAQKWIDSIREAHPDVPVFGRSLKGKIGFQAARLQRIAEGIERAPVTGLEMQVRRGHPLFKIFGRRLSAVQNRALRVAGEGVTIDARIARHQKDIADWQRDLAKATTAPTKNRLRGNINRLNKEIKLLGRVRPLIDDASGKPVIRDPRLREIYDSIKESGLRREDQLSLIDELAPSTAAARVQAPGRYFLGAEWVEPTRARLGKPSPALIRQEARVNRLQGLFDRASARALKGVPAQQAAAVSAAERELNRVVARLGQPAVMPETRMIRQGELKAASDHLAQVREAAGLPPTAPTNPTVQRLGSALGMAKEELERMRTAQARRIEKTGIVGEEAFKGGEQYFTYAQKERPFAGLRGRGQVIRPSPGISHATFTGEAIKAGKIPKGESMLAIEGELEAWRLTALLRNRERLIQFGKPLPERDSDVAMVLDEAKNMKPTPEMQAFLGRLRSGEYLPESERGFAGMVGDGIRRTIFPGDWKQLKHDPDYRYALERPIPGVVWIDKKLLGGIHEPNPLASFAQTTVGKVGFGITDTINNIMKAAILYTLPLKYLSPNLMSQVAFHLIQQGFASPVEAAKSAHTWQHLSQGDRQMIHAGVENGFAASLMGEGGGGLSRFNQWASNIYGKVVDTPFRASSFLYEARRAGARTADEVHDLLHNPAKRDLRDVTFMEANSEIIDYARLGRWERSVIRRLIFFYPWVKGATVYTGRMFLEHPVKAAALDALGRVGSQAQEQILGDELPSYAAALAPWGEAGGMPTTINTMAVNPFTTPYAVGRTILDPSAANTFGFAEQLSPAFSAALIGLTGRDPRGFPARTIPGLEGPLRPIGIGLRQLGEGIPQYRYGKRAIEGPQPNQVYPSPWWENLFALGFGTGVTPRRTNVRRLEEEAERGR